MIFSYIKRKIGMIDVEQDAAHLTIEGVSKLALAYDIQKHWRTTRIADSMFSKSSDSVVKVEHFWVPDLLYILNVLYEQVRWTRTPKRTLKTIIDMVEEKSWVGDVKKTEREHVNLSKLDKLAIHKPADYQKAFITHYLTAVKAFRLKGYMLDSAAGSGKTLTQLFLSHLLNPDGKKIFIVPKNSVSSVWLATLENEWNEDVEGKVWDSIGNLPLNTSYKYYVVHYEQLKNILELVKQNPLAFKGAYLGLDESHNFNQTTSDRTGYFLELSKQKCITNVLWASGTPISKMGTECIPFIKSIDPLFTETAEEGFRRVYGQDAKRGLDILRHRIGHLKYHIPSQVAVDVEKNMIQYNIEIPDGARFTMDEISKNLKAYMNERTHFYNDHRARFEATYKTSVEWFALTPVVKKDPNDFARYKQYVKTISTGYDPGLHKAEARFCNYYEDKVIIPNLPPKMRDPFRQSKSVVKYVHLKILGEALGLLSRYRSECFKAMIPHMSLPTLVDNAKKKTVIFSSYVDVVIEIGSLLEKEGFKPILIYGETNKNLPALVKQFFNDKDANPIVATFQSLSTAVPLYVANRVILTNQPFRENTKTQTIARVARKGQDTEVDVFDIILNTDGKENISTRNQDIMEWSSEMVKAIIGTTNIDLETLSLESEYTEDVDILFQEVYGHPNVEDVPEETDLDALPMPVVEEEESFEGMFSFLGSGKRVEVPHVEYALPPNNLTWFEPAIDKRLRGELKDAVFTFSLDAKTSALITRGGKRVEDKDLLAEITKDVKQTAKMADKHRQTIINWIREADAHCQEIAKELRKSPELSPAFLEELKHKCSKMKSVKSTFVDEHYKWLGVGEVSYFKDNAFASKLIPKNTFITPGDTKVQLTGLEVAEIVKLVGNWPGLFSHEDERTQGGDLPYSTMAPLKALAGKDLMGDYPIDVEAWKAFNVFVEPAEILFGFTNQLVADTKQRIKAGVYDSMECAGIDFNGIPYRISGFGVNSVVSNPGVTIEVKEDRSYEIPLSTKASSLLVRNGVAIPNEAVITSMVADFVHLDRMTEAWEEDIPLTETHLLKYNWLGVGQVDLFDEEGKAIHPRDFTPVIKQMPERVITVKLSELKRLSLVAFPWPGRFTKEEDVKVNNVEDVIIEPPELLYSVINEIFNEIKRVEFEGD